MVERTTVHSPTAIPTSGQKGKMLFSTWPSKGTTASSSPYLTVLNKECLQVGTACRSQVID